MQSLGKMYIYVIYCTQQDEQHGNSGCVYPTTSLFLALKCKNSWNKLHQVPGRVVNCV